MTVLSRESAVVDGMRWFEVTVYHPLTEQSTDFLRARTVEVSKKMARCRLPPIRHLAGKCSPKRFEGKQLPGN